MYGFYKVAAVSPQVKVADIGANVTEIIKRYEDAAANGAAFVLFPELSLTSYTMADLFFQKRVMSEVYGGLELLRAATVSTDAVLIAGAPLLFKDRLYSCAVVFYSGKIIAAVPKSYLPNYREFYERRWFESGMNVKNEWIRIGEERVPFGSDLLFDFEDGSFAIEICEDLWSPLPPSTLLAAEGASIIFNLSASNEYVGKRDYRKDLVKSQSARIVAGYVYASAGVGESTDDLLYGGDLLIAENGSLLAEAERFKRDGETIYAEIDVEKIRFLRVAETSYKEFEAPSARRIDLGSLPQSDGKLRYFDPHPFVPDVPGERTKRCEEIFNIQSHALATRIERVGGAKMVIGVSGGLDSTLALLVCKRCCDILDMDYKNIVAVLMPGFGTSDRTYKNGLRLCESLGVTKRVIDIKEAVRIHFDDIRHPQDLCDVVFENAQARERTQILMDLANKEGGIVVGTGDLSEIALGFSTFNADHISMYNPNASVPKTLVRYLIEWVASGSDEKLADILRDIASTPVSPELLPLKEGKIVQKTEEILGPYEVHDLFLYHFIKYGAPPKKLLFIASRAFGSKYDSKRLKKWLKIFLKRFFANQFKRDSMPNGPKVGTISLSPRGDWRMPSDAVAAEWLAELEE